MFKKTSQINALEDISNWTTSDVLCLLQKNGLEECCKAITKRQIDGSELLQLTEGQLALWKSDLTRPLIWSLWAFIEELKRSPEKFVEEKMPEPQSHEDHFSDTGSWGTDFEDETNDDTALPEVQKEQFNPGFRGSQKVPLDGAESKRKESRKDAATRREEEGTYANCGSIQDDENTYANCQELKTKPTKNVSRLHSQFEKSLAEQLKEQLQLRNTKKPMIVPKPESLQARRKEFPSSDSNHPQKSFLYSKPKPNVPSQMKKRMAVPPPPEPKRPRDQSMIIERPSKDQGKPSSTLRSLDLVANLPARTEESEDEYESFDEQIIELNQKRSMLRTTSKLSLASGHQSSAESVYQPPSVTSLEEDELQYEIYESITETPDDNGYYLSPIQRTPNTVPPPLLPAKPAQLSASSSSTSSWSSLEKTKERSPEKKSATLPHSNSNTSLLSERATRPLPPPPERHSYVDKPWFHNVTREQATALIKEQSTYGNPQNGYFLLRPSTSNANNPLALVLWYNDRVYNVPVRKRRDNRYALGSAKTKEQSFSSVEEIVVFYTREELVLHSNGVQMGSTKLTDTPPK
ncbi:lymphocyte cytosolic protein 2-like [Colletes gigas]|uniref:lymphocyte cytosolic protein 2-like n=1 Tax=Colletes gigas TaxID=935657 RepID=UPI001C9BBA9A|nr:lymphocyte cytosolic protein 2-like [Colletes gigas]